MTTTTMPDPHENKLDALLAIIQSLRLGDMADELPDMLSEAAQNDWGQIDLLYELFHREQVRKAGRRFERNLKASGLTESFGLDHFDFALAREHGVDPVLVRDLAQCEFVRARRNLILAGSVGTGKTFLAKTLGVEALKHGFKVYSFNTANLLDHLHEKRNSFQFGRIYARIRDVDVLHLDDLAYLPYSREKVEYLFSLVVDRYELKRGSTIVTSNTNVTDWWRFFPSKAMGMAFSDRLLDGAQGVLFGGESIRQGRSKRAPRTPREGNGAEVSDKTTDDSDKPQADDPENKTN